MVCSCKDALPELPSYGTTAVLCSCLLRLCRARSITEPLTPSYLSLQMPCPLPWLSMDALSARIESHLLRHLFVIPFATFSIAAVGAASFWAGMIKLSVDASSCSEGRVSSDGLDTISHADGLNKSDGLDNSDCCRIKSSSFFCVKESFSVTSAGVKRLLTAATMARFSSLYV